MCPWLQNTTARSHLEDTQTILTAVRLIKMGSSEFTRKTFVLYCIVFQGPQPHDTYDWTKGRAWMTAHCPDPRPLPRGLPLSSGLTSSSTQPGRQVLWCLRPTQNLNCLCFTYFLVLVIFPSFLLCWSASWIGSVHVFRLLICIHDHTFYLYITHTYTIHPLPPRWVTQGGFTPRVTVVQPPQVPRMRGPGRLERFLFKI